VEPQVDGDHAVPRLEQGRALQRPVLATAPEAVQEHDRLPGALVATGDPGAVSGREPLGGRRLPSSLEEQRAGPTFEDSGTGRASRQPLNVALTLAVSVMVAMFVRAKLTAACCHSALRLEVASSTMVTS